MKLGTAFASSLSLGLFSARADAFLIVPRRSRIGGAAAAAALRAGPSDGSGWDNDDFLNALGGGREKIDEANRQYSAQSNYKAEVDKARAEGAPLPPVPEDYPRRVPPGASGGQAAPPPQGQPGQPQAVPPQQLMPPYQDPYGQQGQPQQQVPPPPQGQPGQQQQHPPPPPQYPNPYAQQQPQPPVPPQYQDPYAQQPQQPPQNYPPPPQGYPNYPPPPYPPQPLQNPYDPYAAPQQPQQPPPPPPPAKRDGRPVGRNQDADSISNAADVYLAQLKRDSTVRTRARYSGDQDTANAVMKSEGIAEMRDMIAKNPYLEAERKLVDTSEDEILVIGNALRTEEEQRPKSYSGVSYRDKMKAALERKRKGGGGALPAPTDGGPVPAPVDVSDHHANPLAGSLTKGPPPAAKAASPAKEPVPAVVEAAAAETPVAVAPAVVEEAAAATTAAPPVSEEEARRNVRTLMGLLLKHRGGAGFGKGRLVGSDVDRFQETSSSVIDMLKSEVDAGGGAATAAPAVVEKAEVARAEAPAPPVSVVAKEEVAAPVATATTADDDGIPASLRGAVACVEGALNAYKNAPTPAERDALLMPFRAALLSAANACNKVIAEAEVENVAAYKAATGVEEKEEEKPVFGFPTTYAVTKPEEEEEEQDAPETAAEWEASAIDAALARDDDDANTALFREAYSSLRAAAGDEKLGLKSLSSDEAASLADRIAEIRGVMMEELDAGVPPSPVVGSSPAASSATATEATATATQKKSSESAAAAEASKEDPSSSSLYQKMLAKSEAAKAAKAAKRAEEA